MSDYQFPRWTDAVRPVMGYAAIIVPIYLVGLMTFAFSADNLNRGYAPVQPMPYSHALHAGQLGIDCRYCHNTVENAAMAALPSTSTCMNCHARIRPDSPLLAPLRESVASGNPIEWVRVHDLPEFAYFNHSAHLSAGVGCVECHGRVDQMDVVRQEENLSMSWCLECHRDPAPRLRPQDQLTNLAWETTENRELLGQRLIAENNIHPRQDCSTCHR